MHSSENSPPISDNREQIVRFVVSSASQSEQFLLRAAVQIQRVHIHLQRGSAIGAFSAATYPHCDDARAHVANVGALVDVTRTGNFDGQFLVCQTRVCEQLWRIRGHEFCNDDAAISIEKLEYF